MFGIILSSNSSRMLDSRVTVTSKTLYLLSYQNKTYYSKRVLYSRCKMYTIFSKSFFNPPPPSPSSPSSAQYVLSGRSDAQEAELYGTEWWYCIPPVCRSPVVTADATILYYCFTICAVPPVFIILGIFAAITTGRHFDSAQHIFSRFQFFAVDTC